MIGKKMKIRIKLDPGAEMPTRAHEADAGFDLYAERDAVVPAEGSAEFYTGVHVEIPFGYVGFLKSKSGLNVKHGITSEGVIDSGFTGSIRVKLYNHSSVPYRMHKGDKITQLVILKCELPTVEVVDELDETDRGENGFGSSGR